MRISEENFRTFYDAEEELETSYPMMVDDDTFKGWIDDYTILQIIEDLTEKVRKLKKDLEEQQEKFDEKINDFYNPKSPYEIYGINEDMFH